MGLSHIDSSGNAVMINIGEKRISKRKAVATGRIKMNRECFDAIRNGGSKKGNVLSVARIAGIMAAKRAAELIPLCHTLNLEKCSVEFRLHHQTYEISVVCAVVCEGKTGVEMEALTAVSVTLLTVYDMCKAIDKHMEIGGIHLLEKTGGKSGRFLYAQKEDEKC